MSPGASPELRYLPLPPPSLLELTPEPLPPAPPAWLVRLVLGLRRWLTRLADSLCPAELALLDRATGVASTGLLGAVARHGIADLLAERGACSAEAIALELSLDADAVHRSLRALANMGVFRMHASGTFENNRLSRALCSGQRARSREWVLYFSSGSNAACWLDVSRTLAQGESAFSRLHGMDVWQWFEHHPDEREMFAHCMMGATLLDAPVIAGLYPFGDVRRLCDVGGGRGTLLSEILIRHAHLRGVLYDSPGVIESARPLLAQRGVSHRVELIAGSFFDAVPGGCDAYLLKNILHDWDDETCIRLLANIRRAAAPASRLIICEALVERCSRDAIGTRTDLQMMVVCEQGRERSRRELDRLLRAAGFYLRRCIEYPTLSLLEAAPV